MVTPIELKCKLAGGEDPDTIETGDPDGPFASIPNHNPFSTYGQASCSLVVTFHLENKGALTHEIMIGRDVAMMEDFPHGYRIDFFENAGMEPMVTVGMAMEEDEEEMHTGYIVAVPGNGGSSTMMLTFADDVVGKWEIGCFEQDGVHYTAGMKGTLIVNP